VDDDVPDIDYCSWIGIVLCTEKVIGDIVSVVLLPDLNAKQVYVYAGRKLLASNKHL
jgi:hypothetical protein